MYKTLLVCLSLLCLTDRVQAADHLLYFEAQGIAGYSSEVKKPIYYSMNPDAEMQKPGLGFDYIQLANPEILPHWLFRAVWP